MRLENWLVIESFILPESRHRIPLIYRYARANQMREAGALIAEQIKVAEQKMGRSFNFDEKAFKELSRFLVDNRDALLSRLNAIRLRSAEPETEDDYGS